MTRKRTPAVSPELFRNNEREYMLTRGMTAVRKLVRSATHPGTRRKGPGRHKTSVPERRGSSSVTNIYFQQIAHSLLTPDEEQALGVVIHKVWQLEMALAAAVKQQKKENHPDIRRALQKERDRMMRELTDRKQACDYQAALDTLVRQNLRLAAAVARRYHQRNRPLCELPDLIQEANVGLFAAARRFDPTCGTRFSTYAYWWIRAAVFSYCAEHQTQIRVPAAVRYAQSRRERNTAREPCAEGAPASANGPCVSARGLRSDLTAIPRVFIPLDAHVRGKDGEFGGRLGDMIPSAEEFPGESYEHDELRRFVRQFVRSSPLSGREQEVICRRFGIAHPMRSVILNNQESGETCDAIGKRFGVTRERIRQIEEKALRKLRRYARSSMYGCP